MALRDHFSSLPGLFPGPRGDLIHLLNASSRHADDVRADESPQLLGVFLQERAYVVFFVEVGHISPAVTEVEASTRAWDARAFAPIREGLPQVVDAGQTGCRDAEGSAETPIRRRRAGNGKNHRDEALGTDRLSSVNQDAIACGFPTAPVLTSAHACQTQRPHAEIVRAELVRERAGLRYGQRIPLARRFLEFAYSADLTVQTMGGA